MQTSNAPVSSASDQKQIPSLHHALVQSGTDSDQKQIITLRRFLAETITDRDWLDSLDRHEAAMIRGGVASVEETILDAPAASRTKAGLVESADQPSANPMPYWSESLQTVLDQPPSSLPRNFILAGLAFCSVISVWAWFGKVQDVSRAQGQLIPEGEVYKVQPVVQSEIARILVKEGEAVKAGQLIAELDSRIARAEVERLQQTLNSYQQQLLQNQGLINAANLEANTRQAIAAADLRAQAAAIVEAEAAADTNRKLLEQLQAETSAHESRLSRLQPLLAAGAIPREYVFEVEQSLRSQERTMTQNQGEVEKALAEAKQLQAGLDQRRAEGKKSELEAKERLQQLEIEATQLQAKITETETLLRVAQARMQQMFLYAPCDGTVLSLNVRNFGEVAQPGETIAEIAPAGEPLVLSALLPNREAGLVAEGMPVQVKFDAFPHQDYGVVSGTVTSISPDAKTDEQQGAVYRVEVSLDRHYVTHNQQKVEFKPGQTASAEIVTRQRRIIDVVLDPIRQLQRSGINL